MRRFIPILIAAAAVAIGVAVPALATAPAITLTAPVGHQGKNPPTFTGVAGHAEGDSSTVQIRVWAGTDTSGEAATTFTTFANEGNGSFNYSPELKFTGCIYTAIAYQSHSGEETPGSSAPVTFSFCDDATPTPTPTPVETAVPTSTPIVVAATPTATPVATPIVQTVTKPYVCASRRDFVKHVHKAKGGTHFKVVATLNGKTWKSTVGANQILVRLNLVGLPKDTYTLKVAVTYTNVRGKRVTTNNVSHVDYHTCTPKPMM